MRLACLPHAGGAASYFLPLSRALRNSVEVLCVQYPGRQDRRFEPMIDDIGKLADEVARALLPWHESGPLALLGHSMGASVAFEAARRLEQDTARGPLALFVSARRAPSEPVTETVHLRDDAGLVAEIRILSGTQDTLLDDTELLAAALPAIRNDYTAIETYRCTPDARVGCPVTALIGLDDPRVTVAQAEGWREHTTGPFSLRTYPGGHFFPTEQVGAVAADLRSLLADPFAPDVRTLT